MEPVSSYRSQREHLYEKCSDVSWAPEPRVPKTVEFSADWFTNPQGIRLRTYKFGQQGTSYKGVVILCHGYASNFWFDWVLPSEPGGAHEKWEGSFAQGLVDAGYYVVGADHQSHGRSDGKDGSRCYIDAFDDLPRELISFLESDVMKRQELQGLPVFAFGESMGGAVVVRMAQLAPKLLRGCVLLAPMLSLEEVKKAAIFCCITNGHLAPFVGCLNTLMPKMPVASPARNTVNPLSQLEFDSDPLNYHGNVRTRVAKEFKDITDAFMGGLLEDMDVPFLTFHSVKDTFTDPLGSDTIAKVAKTSDKTYLRVGEGLDVNVDIWHGLAVEPGHDVVFAKALGWIQART